MAIDIIDNESTSDTVTKTPKLGLDQIIGDVIGLNLEGLKTILGLFKNPAPYFNAAKDADWLGTYRPSIRIWLAVFAATTACKFLWVSDSAPLFKVFRQAIEGIAQQTNAQISDTTQHITFTGIYRAWGEKIGYVIRLRYLFGIMIAGNFTGLILSMSAVFIPASVYQSINYVFMAVMYGLYFLTAYRGPLSHLEGSAQFGRAAAVTATLIISTLMATIVAIIIAIRMTMVTYF